MRDFFVWMSETPWSIGLRESFYVWPMLQASHVMSLTLFVGAIDMADVRLLGWGFQAVAVSEFDKRILPLTIIGFLLLLVTGLLLFYAKPLDYYHSLFFRLKMLIILAALVIPDYIKVNSRSRRGEPERLFFCLGRYQFFRNVTTGEA
jgi:hypothetical protein